MKQERKKSPKDYPQFSFRVAETEKVEIQRLVEEVCTLYNRDKTEADYVVRKNDVLVEALLKGLKELKQNLRGRGPKK